MRHLILVALLFSFACAPSRKGHAPNDRKPLTEEQTNEFQKDLARFKTPASQLPVDIKRYDLHAELDWATETLAAYVDISFVLTKNATELFLDAAVQNISKIESLSGETLSYSWDRKDELLKVSVASLKPNAQGDLQIRIHYTVQADLSSGLQAVQARKGDPVRSRVFFTFSEPQAAHYWMPSHDHPSDRAVFSAELTLVKGEVGVANGDLVQNEVLPSGKRVMRYETRYSLPTYLMAFAGGEFEHATTWHDNLPVSVWWRRGLNADVQGVLRETVRQIKHFETLLPPYPFEKYSIILVPEFSGGIEHAGITFNNEERSSQSLARSDLSIMAHELGHQWFGDYMTVATWDDLWIKEGMATLLAAEAERSFEDKHKTGGLNGDQFWVDDGDAVIDPALQPDEKYTSGPYERAAWVLTQIRHAVGEKVFWKTLSEILQAHAFGNIGTEEFIESFRPALGDARMVQLRASLTAHKLPKFDVVSSQPGELTLKLLDPEGALFVPLELSWMQGSLKTLLGHMQNNSEYSFPSMPEGFLVMDAADAHPPTDQFWAQGTHDLYAREVYSRAYPKNTNDRATFARLSAGAQSLVWQAGGSQWALAPSEFQELYDGLGSDGSRVQLLRTACERAKAAPSVEWTNTLNEAFSGDLPYKGFYAFAGMDFSACREVLGDAPWANDFALMARDPDSDFLSEIRLIWMSHWSMPFADFLPKWKPLAIGAGNVRMKHLAVRNIQREFARLADSPTATPAVVEAGKVFFRDIYASVELSRMMGDILPVFQKTMDREALPLLRDTLLNPLVHRRVRSAPVCVAYTIINGKPDAAPTAEWNGFVQSLGDLNLLPAAVRSKVLNPNCQ